MSRWPLLVLPLLLTATACKSVLPSRAPAAERADELTRLKETVRELQQQARMNEVEVARLRRQVAELAERLAVDAAAPAIPRQPSPSRQPAPAVESTPPIESTTPVVPPRPVAAQGVEAEDLEVAGDASPTAAPEPPPTPVSGEGQALYDRGYTLYHQDLHVDAESAFQSFLQQYPASDLADNAQFWIGEARLRRGDLNGALAAFRETVTRFPRGNKVPDALFRSGDCLEQLGDLDGAREAWRRTIERFPNSAAAALSEERLAAVP